MENHFQALDTTGNSPIHRWVRKDRELGSLEVHPLSRAYMWACLLTFMPMLALATADWLMNTEAQRAQVWPFFADFPVAFMFLVSFPTLLVFCLDDNRRLVAALSKLESDGIVKFGRAEGALWVRNWNAHFRKINVWALAGAIAIGAAVALANLGIYSDKSLGYWITRGDTLLPIGYLFVLNCFVFYMVTPFFVFRSVAISRMLQDLVAKADIDVLPLHPDKSGGLRPIGRMGIRYQFLLTAFGLNVVLLAFFSFKMLPEAHTLHWAVIAAGVAYLICGPAVFIGPLVPFRTAMLKGKQELMDEITEGMKREFPRIRSRLKTGESTAGDHESVERLQHMGSLIEALPVWPFDRETLKQFVTAYLLPVLGALGFSQLEEVLNLLGLG